MTVFSLIASHQDVDLDTIARLSAGASDVLSSVPASDVQGAVVLATCNRVEIYSESAAGLEEARRGLLAAVTERTGLSPDAVAGSFRVLESDAAARHLFQVAAGLESAVVGEREIAGQVRRALVDARSAGTATGPLVRLFEAATRTAKDVGSKTALGATGRSVVSVALDIAEQLRGVASPQERDRFWAGANVLLIGTGSYAGTTLAQLQERGATAVGVHSASGRAAQFVQDRGGWALPIEGEEMAAAIAEADVIIGSSGTGHQIGPEQLRGWRRDALSRVTLIDLALSRDFDPAVDDLDEVDLITLESVRLASPEQAEAAVTEARVLVEESLRDYGTVQRSRGADSAIKALRSHTLATLDQELERVRRRHGCTGPAEEVEFALRHMVKQFLHDPTVRARQLAAEGRLDEYERALEVLFGIEVEPEARPSDAERCPGAGDDSAPPTALRA